MLLRKVTWMRGALAGLLFFGFAVAQAQAQATKIGIFYTRPGAVALGKALGVHYERFVMPVTGDNGPQLQRIREAEEAGFRLNVQFTNIRGGETGVKPGPVTDDNAFESELSADLDASRPELVTIQNEEDGLEFWSGTPDDYLHELSDAVRVAHAKGYRISNGGLTVTGIKLAYWHYLWSSGQRDLADRFAQSALTPDLTNGNAILGDIPDSSEPGRPILANNRPMRAKLARVERLLAGYPSTGIDYVNIHWYESGPEELAEVTNWLSRATGLPVICNEMGQFSYSPETVTALLSEAESLRMAYIFWFANDGRGRARGLAGEDDTPGENGMAFRAFVTSH